MVTYIKNFANSFLQKDLQKEFFGSKAWQWQYRAETSSLANSADFGCLVDSNTEDVPQFIHIVDSNSRDMMIISPLIYRLVEIVGHEVTFIRIKANLLWPDQRFKNTDLYHIPHVDHGRDDAKTLIYYVNDSDGDTIIFKNRWNGEDPGKLVVDQKIRPKSGDAILFDSNIYHASSSPTEGIRSVINFIFYPKSNDPSSTNEDIPPIPTSLPVGKGFIRE
jgi:hypothetical protein